MHQFRNIFTGRKWKSLRRLSIQLGTLAAVWALMWMVCVSTANAADGVPPEVMDATQSVVRILSEYYDQESTGSGFVIKNENGEILIATNQHVVENNPYRIAVWIGENQLADAEIVFSKEEKDLCVLRVYADERIEPVQLSSEDARHGAAIYAVGFPAMGDVLSDDQAHTSDSATITDGIVSAIRTFTIVEGEEPVTLLQISAAINPGNSGGPVFDSNGMVIGISTFAVSYSQGIFGAVDIGELRNQLEIYGIELPAPADIRESAEAEMVTMEMLPPEEENNPEKAPVAAWMIPALVCILFFGGLAAVIVFVERKGKRSASKTAGAGEGEELPPTKIEITKLKHVRNSTTDRTDTEDPVKNIRITRHGSKRTDKTENTLDEKGSATTQLLERIGITKHRH